jgi:hypothetical protein
MLSARKIQSFRRRAGALTSFAMSGIERLSWRAYVPANQIFGDLLPRTRTARALIAVIRTRHALWTLTIAMQ